MPGLEPGIHVLRDQSGSKDVDGRDEPAHDGSGRVAGPPPVVYFLPMTAQQARESTPSVASAHDKILIVDFGSQVTQLIARRVREEGVYSEIVPFQKAEAAFKEMKPKAVILSGGPESVHEEGSPRAPQAIFDSGVPVLGICYGQMTMAAQLGGIVEGGHHREFGGADVEVKAASRLFDSMWSMGERHPVWMSHGDRITSLPPGFEVAGISPNAPFAVIQDEKRKYYGLMFHPEVVHTPDGAKLIRNFVHEVAGLTGDWTMRAFRAEAPACRCSRRRADVSGARHTLPRRDRERLDHWRPVGDHQIAPQRRRPAGADESAPARTLT